MNKLPCRSKYQKMGRFRKDVVYLRAVYSAISKIAVEVYFALYFVAVKRMQVARESALTGTRAQESIKAADELQLHLHLCRLFGKLRHKKTKYLEHAVKHQQSYRSVDCRSDGEKFCDSSIAKGMTVEKQKQRLCLEIIYKYL